MGYSASVATSVASVTVTATTTDGGATLTIDGTPTDSGVASGAIELTAGDGVADGDDVDDDNDGLIEINTLEDLDSVRHDLAGTSRKTSAGDSGPTTRAGAPTAATDNCDTATADGVYLCGYELARSLDFAQAGSYADGTINSDWRPTGGAPATATNAGFVPIGDFDNRFVAIFEGNGFTIRNLYVNKSGQFAGLFGATDGSAIARLGLPDATVRASGMTVGNQYVGALVGYNDTGSIELCHSTGLVSGSGDTVGGLVGQNLNTGVTIAASYSSSAVSGDSGVGGLVARSQFGDPTIINGHWDSETTGQTTSFRGGTGLPIAQMQAAGGSDFSDGFRDGCGSPFDFRSADEAARYPRLKLLTAGGDTDVCSDDDYHASELLGGQ